VERRA